MEEKQRRSPNKIRYAIAYYVSSRKEIFRNKMVPIGIVVVDEENKELGLKYLNTEEIDRLKYLKTEGVDGLEGLIKKMYPFISKVIKEEFEDYLKESEETRRLTDEDYKRRLSGYYGFITRLLSDSHGTIFSFSNSKPMEEEGSVEEAVERLFEEKVVRYMDFLKWTKKINEMIGHDPQKKSSYYISFEPCFENLSHKELLEGYIHMYLPLDLQEKVKKEIQDFANRGRMHFVVTTIQVCDNNYECHGHYVNPLETAKDDKHVFVDTFPEDMNSAYVHFLNEKNYQIFEETRKPE